jgi:hypothetical protein
MKQPMNKAQWVELFVALGLDEAAMHRWHALFETRHPDAHQAFLEWLNIPAREIDAIRTYSRS